LGLPWLLLPLLLLVLMIIVIIGVVVGVPVVVPVPVVPAAATVAAAVAAAVSGRMRHDPAVNRLPDAAGYRPANPALSGTIRRARACRILPDSIKLFFSAHIFSLAGLALAA